MSRTERIEKLEKQFRVQDSNGATHTLELRREFIRLQLLDGSWSQLQPNLGRYTLNGKPVNPTDDENVFELAETGEKLTVIPSSQ